MGGTEDNSDPLSPLSDTPKSLRLDHTKTLPSAVNNIYIDMVDHIIVSKEKLAESELRGLEAFRLRTKKFFAYSFFGDLYTWFFIVLSIVSAFQFIYATYLDVDEPSLAALNLKLNYAEMAYSILFLLDHFLGFFIADDKITHMFG